MKDFSGKRLLQIPELLQSFPTTVRMNLFIWQTKEKNTLKRWIGKRLHQCNLEIENRDLTKQLYWQHKFYSKVAEHELKFQMLIRFLFQATLSHTFHQYNFYKALLFLFSQDCVYASNAKEVIIYVTLIQRRMLFIKILQKASSINELPYSSPVKGGRTQVTGRGQHHDH